MASWDGYTCEVDDGSGGNNGNDSWTVVCPEGRYRTTGNYCADCGLNCDSCAEESGACETCKDQYQPMSDGFNCFIDPADVECPA
jgi:hypothetical protein